MKIEISPDKELVEEIRAALRKNDQYCPCRPVKNPETKCMCKEFLEGPLGACHCGLYVKIEL